MSQRNDESRLARDAARFLGFGLTWALGTGLFLMAGWFLDKWVGTVPLFTIVGSFVGAGGGFYSLYYNLVIEPRKRAERERAEGDPR